MDRFLDVLFDPKVLIAGVVGWTIRGLIIESKAAQGQPASVRQMAGRVVERQAKIASDHAIKRVSDLADDRTRQVVDAFLPRARSKAETQVVQLTIPK